MKELIMLLTVACATTATGPGASKGDLATAGLKKCVTVDAPSLIALVAQFGATALAGAVKNGKPDWNALVDSAIGKGAELGGCAFVALYHAYDQVQPEAAVRSLIAEPDPRRTALERMRAQMGGPRWELADGTVL